MADTALGLIIEAADAKAENVRLRAEVARLAREIAEVERFRAAPLSTIRKLLGDEESPDEAIAGSVCAILLTRQETVRRKQAAEKERDALRACVTQLVGALRNLLEESGWRTTRVSQTAREALAAAEKLTAPD